MRSYTAKDYAVARKKLADAQSGHTIEVIVAGGKRKNERINEINHLLEHANLQDGEIWDLTEERIKLEESNKGEE